MNTSVGGLERLRRSRARTLLFSLPLSALLWAGAAWLVRPPLHGSVMECGLYLAGALFALAMLLPVRSAVRSGVVEQQVRLAWIALLVFIGLLVIRLGVLLFDVAVARPDFNLFRPVFAFLPLIYVGIFLLLPRRQALMLGWMLGGGVLVLTLLAVWLNDWTLARAGLPEVLLWLLCGNPLFLAALHAMPALEDALHRSVEELARLREQAALHDRIAVNERRFNLVVDSLQVGVWDQRFESGELVEQWWSPRYYELVGYAAEELPASDASAHRLFGDSYLLVRSALYAQLRERNGIAALDTRLHTRHRGPRWFNISAKAEFDAQRRFTRITGAIEDIHEQRTAEESLLEAQAALSKLAYRDALTGLPNRRAFNDQLQREWDRARRVGQPVALLAIDLDWFKSYNDRYGHPAGDEYLKLAAACFSQCLRRPADLAARVGGEEFCVLLPETDLAGACSVAEKIGQTMRELGVPHEDSPYRVVTCSIGVNIGYPREGGTPEALVEGADAALYQSKRRGRARVSMLPQGPLRQQA